MSYLLTLRNENSAVTVGIATLGAALAISLFYTPLPLIVLLGVPLCLYFLHRPYELLLFMVFLIPFNFIFTIGSVPIAAELLKAVAWVPFLLTRSERPSFIGSRFNKWFAVLAALLVLSLFRARDFPFTLKECVRFGTNLGLVYLCLNLVDTREKVIQVLKVLTVSTFLVACYGFYQWAIQDYGALFWIVNPRLDTSLAHYRDEFWQWRNRIISVLTSEMELGHYFNLCLPIGAMLWMTEGRKRLGSKWLAMTVAIFVGLILTFTFGAWLALVVTSMLFVLSFGGKRRWKFFGVSLLIVSVVGGALALGPLRPVIEAKAGGTAIGSVAWDAATRLYGWKIALQTWWAHPLIGAGTGNFESLSANFDFVRGGQSQGSSPHQTYLFLLANYGFIGTFSVVTIMLATIRKDLWLARNSQPNMLIALALAFALSVNMIGWFADDSGFFGPHTGYLLWLLVGLSEVTAILGSRNRHGDLAYLPSTP
jgi:O-Antigen ligase